MVVSLLPGLPDISDITRRFERGQGEISSKLDAIIVLLERLTEIMTVQELLRGFDPADVSTPALAAVSRDGRPSSRSA